MWRQRSNVDKLGGIPCSTTAGYTCPISCSLRGAGCYAEFGFGGWQWKRLSRGEIGIEWRAFLAHVQMLPEGQLWRHNLAGDLPGEGDTIDAARLMQLTLANLGRRGFTFTHKPTRLRRNRLAIRAANRGGFTINLSAGSPAEADRLAELGIGPVVTLMPSDAWVRHTPAGRPIIVCPSQRRDVTCADCQLCASPNRTAIVGFMAHGQMKRRVSLRVLQHGGAAA